MAALPIDYSRRPWREKYVDETPRLARWFIFGQFLDGTVGITDADTSIFDRVPRDVAERIIAARDVFCDAIVKELCGG